MASEVLLTDKIRRWIHTVLTTETLPEGVRQKLTRATTRSKENQQEGKQDTILFALVLTAYSYMKNQQNVIYLHELLEGSDIYLRSVEPAKRNPELEERIQRLKREQENQQYAEMSKDIQGGFGDPITINAGQEVQSVNQQIMMIFNFLLTVIGSFVFVYKATEYWLDEPSVPLQICNGMIIATLVFFADLYFLVKFYGAS